MVYEVKIYCYKSIIKTSLKGSVFIYKEYKRWVCTYKQKCKTKKHALKLISMCLSLDKSKKKGLIEEYKYSIRVLKGGAKRGKA